MKLVIENLNGRIYAMIETERHHKQMDRAQLLHRPLSALDNESDLRAVLGEGEYLVVDVTRR